MELELKEIRKEISSYENKLIDLINERVSLGEKVAEIKYKYLKEIIDNSDEKTNYNTITNEVVENKIYTRLKDNIKDEELSNIIINLYREYIIPKTKDVQISTFNKLKNKKKIEVN